MALTWLSVAHAQAELTSAQEERDAAVTRAGELEGQMRRIQRVCASPFTPVQIMLPIRQDTYDVKSNGA